MALKKLGQNVTFTVDGESSAFIRNVKRNRNQAKVETTGLTDATSGSKTYQQGLKDVEISLELMHPQDGESPDAGYTTIKTALDNGTPIASVVFEDDTYTNMAVAGGEESADVDGVFVTNITLFPTQTSGS